VREKSPYAYSLQDSNVILSNAFEYRAPSKKAEAAATEQAERTGESSKADMTSRFMGLIVIPKHHIVKIELEERRSEPGVMSQDIPIRPKG
jgi:N-alpha-acetyltransferase 38, NatC auxiliary subunit